MKTKKLTAVAMAALLGSLSANAALVAFDDFDAGALAPDAGDINNNIHIRQAPAPMATWSSYSPGGSPGANTMVLDTASPFGVVMYVGLTAAAGGDHATTHMNTDFGAALGGNEWSISYDEYRQGNDGAGGGWGGWAGLFIGDTIGYGADFGLLLRPDGAFSVLNGTTAVASGGAGSLSGNDALYATSVTFDEVANTVSVSQNGVEFENLALTLTGASRYVQFRTHFDGSATGTAQIDIFRDNLLIDAVPEPATLGLFGLIGGGMLWIRKRMAI